MKTMMVIKRRSLCHQILLLITLLIVTTLVTAEEGGAGASPSASSEAPKVKPEVEADTFNAKDHTDWGSYYDPKNIFCGKYDCYKILGFDYENYGKEKPSTKVITKRYRSLSREWHPDKSKHKDAKERFVKIARAYEVLTDVQQRKEYDFMRYNQEAYFQKYGASVMFKYAPKSDMVLVVALLLAVANWFSWAAQKQRWQQVANRLIQAAVEDWSPSQGGSPESKQLREQALEQLKEEDSQLKSGDASANGKASGKAKKGAKLSAKDKKKQEQERVRPIVTKLVDSMDDFGAGFHKPTWRDLLLVKMIYWPYYLVTGTFWQLKYYMRRLQGLELNDDERSVLTERAVGPVAWDLASEEERAELTKLELWVMSNLVEWKEEQEVKTWSKADQKMYAKMKKKKSFNKDE